MRTPYNNSGNMQQPHPNKNPEWEQKIQMKKNSKTPIKPNQESKTPHQFLFNNTYI
jgi:hypothetical protein